VVRQWFAKPSFEGSIPSSASSLKTLKIKGLSKENHPVSGGSTFANFGQNLPLFATFTNRLPIGGFFLIWPVSYLISAQNAPFARSSPIWVPIA
jgi:hypothetical protein